MVTRCIGVIFTILWIAATAHAQTIDLSRFHFVHVTVAGEQVQYDHVNNPITRLAPIQIDNAFDSVLWDSTTYHASATSSYSTPPQKGSPPYWESGSESNTTSGSIDTAMRAGVCYVHLNHHWLETDVSNIEVSGDDHIQDCTLTALHVLENDSAHLILGSDVRASLSYSATDREMMSHEWLYNYTAHDTTIPSNPVSIRVMFSLDRAGDTVRILADVSKHPGGIIGNFTIVPTVAAVNISVNLRRGAFAISNIFGQQVFSAQESEDGIISLDTHSWPNGTYFARFNSDAGSASAKFIVQH